jgi:hypothetical protein
MNWNAWLSGILIAALAVAALALFAEWPDWLALAAGVWVAPIAVGAAVLVSREGHTAPRHRWNCGCGRRWTSTLVHAPEPSPRDGLIPDKGGSGRPPLSSSARMLRSLSLLRNVAG